MRDLFALALMQSTFRKFAELKKQIQALALSRSASPGTRNQPWGPDARRLLSLEQTPWARQAKGGTEDAKWVSLLQADELQEWIHTRSKQLETLQLQSGAWPWIAGGEEDFLITEMVLEQLAAMKSFAEWRNEAYISRALRYYASKLSKTKVDPAPGAQGRDLVSGFWTLTIRLGSRNVCRKSSARA